jgi:hypothetical protein
VFYPQERLVLTGAPKIRANKSKAMLKAVALAETFMRTS